MMAAAAVGAHIWRQNTPDERKKSAHHILTRKPWAWIISASEMIDNV